MPPLFPNVKVSTTVLFTTYLPASFTARLIPYIAPITGPPSFISFIPFTFQQLNHSVHLIGKGAGCRTNTPSAAPEIALVPSHGLRAAIEKLLAGADA